MSAANRPHRGFFELTWSDILLSCRLHDRRPLVGHNIARRWTKNGVHFPPMRVDVETSHPRISAKFVKFRSSRGA